MDVEPKLFEGDIVPAPDQGKTSGDNLRDKRNARRVRQYLWKSKVIPYHISSELGEFSVFVYSYHVLNWLPH